jgi:phospholipase C
MAPLHYALADRYTLCDRWFASLMAATWPNRFYLHAASSNGRTTNVDWGPGDPVTIWERMADACRSAKNYYAGSAAWYSVAFVKRAVSGGGALVPERIEHFFRDARDGTLPDFAIIDPDFHVNDLHPPHTLAMGEAFLGAVVRAIEESPQWGRTLLVVTYDECGGFYDHVPPPTTVDPRPEFGQLGFRVPALLIGPSVWQGRVVSTPFEHVSVLATLRTRFGVASLGPRMDAAADLSPCIDPDLVTAPTAPRLRAHPPVALPAAQLAACCGWENSQEEMEAAVRAGAVPATHLDPRPVSERLAAWLEPAQALGAVRVVR